MGDAVARQRSSDEETEKEPYGGVQGQGGAGRAQGRRDAGRAVREVRCPRQSDRAVEDAVAGWGAGGVPDSGGETGVPGSRCQGHAGEDRPIGIGERFFGRRARSHRRCERKEMIDATHELPVTRQAELLDLSRSNVYYLPRLVSAADLAMMRRIDELHLNFPFAGARMLRDMLKLEGVEVGRKHVRTLMERMGIAGIYRKRKTSAPHPAHALYPYLLKNLTMDRPHLT